MVQNLRKRVFIGVVGGSDFEKQKEQLGNNGAVFSRWQGQHLVSHPFSAQTS